MRKAARDGTGPAQQDPRHTNVEEYLAGLRAAIRTHQRLTGGSDLRVEVQGEVRIPLAQRILLR